MGERDICWWNFGNELPVFRPKVWENIAQGEPLRRRPGFTHRNSSSLQDCEPGV